MYYVPKNFAAEPCDRKVSFIVNFSVCFKVLFESGYVVVHSVPIVFYRCKPEGDITIIFAQENESTLPNKDSP
jgi:hypothetical protein